MDKANLVFRATLADDAKRYPDMVENMRQVAILHSQNFNSEDRRMLAKAYEHQYMARATSLTKLSQYIRKNYQRLSVHKRNQVRMYQEQIKNEIVAISSDILTILDDQLLPNSTTQNANAFYLCLKGDYNKYLMQATLDSNVRPRALDTAREAYEAAYAICRSELSSLSELSLRVSLNFSTFLNDTLNNPGRGCQIAAQAVRGALQLVRFGDRPPEIILNLIVQLQSKLLYWTGDQQLLSIADLGGGDF